MLTLNDGRSELWQWDTGRKLTVDVDCSQVHFSNKVFGRSIDVDVIDGIAIIPDILLQTDKDLTALAFVGTAENGYTKVSKVFKVNKRNKPADYVFTQQDQSTLGEILDRIEDLENRPSGDVSKEDIQNAVNDYLDKNPVSVVEKDPTVPAWAKQPNKPKYTAAEVGALPADTPIPEGVTDEQIKNAVGAYLTENPVESSGSKWRLIGDVMTTEAVSTVEVYGETPLNEMLVFTSVPAINEDPGGTAYYKVKMMSENGTLSDMITGILVTKPYTRNAIRHIFRVDALGGSAQKWDASAASSPSYIGFAQNAALNIRDAHLNGYVLVGFQIYWNLEYTLPAGVHLQVWGR